MEKVFSTSGIRQAREHGYEIVNHDEDTTNIFYVAIMVV
jgi:hypothetical protein